jgi:hypothetical protein
LLLILALILMLDLAEDGCFGEATLDLPVALTKTYVSTPDQKGSGQVDFCHEFPLPNLWEPPARPITSKLNFRVQPTLKIIDHHNISSYGGIPH